MRDVIIQLYDKKILFVTIVFQQESIVDIHLYD